MRFLFTEIRYWYLINRMVTLGGLVRGRRNSIAFFLTPTYRSDDYPVDSKVVLNDMGKLILPQLKYI